MDKRWTVNGIFIVEVEGKDRSEAREKAARILRNSGITGFVIDEKVVSDEQEQKSIMAEVLNVDRATFHRYRSGFVYGVAERLGWY